MTFQQTVEKKFFEFMEVLGLDMNDASLKDTPKRVAKMFIQETCKWLFEKPPKVTSFPNDWWYDWMVLVKGIEVKSLCEHHFQPFIWVCHIAYIPKDRIIWLSKFARITDYFSRRPQVQERLGTQIFEFIKKELQTEDIAVYIESEHFCMSIRWVQQHWTSTVTSNLGWWFKTDDKLRQEFYNAIKADGTKWGYVPTKEEKLSTRMKVDHFKLSWDWIFHTIQWEWPFAWRPTTFVRLHHCNLQCTRCDARYTRKKDTEEFYTEPYDVHVDQMREKIRDSQWEYWIKCNNITITWWEPMMQMQNIKKLIIWVAENEWINPIYQIETNGTIMPTDMLLSASNVYFNCSPKLWVSWNEWRTRYSEKVLKKLSSLWKRVSFKFVVKTIEDIKEVEEKYKDLVKKEQIRIMPEWVTTEENREVFDRTMSYILGTWFNVAVRWQNVMRDWAIRWV